MHSLASSALAPLVRTLVPLVCVLSLCVALAACSRTAGPQPAGNQPVALPLKAVATIGMIGDVVREVGGERVRVTNLMGEGVDPHLYKASPGDVRTMSEADLLFYNGLHLEGRLADVIVRMASTTTVVQATDAIPEASLRQPAEFAGHFDPHAWFDASLWQLVTQRVRDALIAKDPAGTDVYTTNAKAYAQLLSDVHAYAKSTLGTIPQGNRVMVTAHDAFGYFGAAYGLEVLGIQGISTDSEASLQDINALVDTLVSRNVPAVFIESSVPRKTIDALIEGCKGRGHTIVIGGELFSDAMGKAGTLEGTYVGMMLHNIDTVTKALGGSVPSEKPASIAAYVQRARATSTPAP
jgi:manganese/zinc/iron transport system substrate-binding protein